MAGEGGRTTPLAERMRDFATKDHALHVRLCDAADALETASASGDAKTILGAWARARLVWQEASGEGVISEAAIQTGANLFSALNSLRQDKRRP
jgi:hypothetical protein